MNKYINADKFERDCMFDKNCEDMQDVIYKLRDYPSADVVEVVRCKDCKHYATDNGGVCNKENGGLMFSTKTDFCSYGERKETK
jgi:hypothetical protein